MNLLQSPKKLATLTGALFLLSPSLSYLAPAAKDQSLFQTTARREQANSSAFAMMLGEFRTSVGDLLFLKTERYMHSGIAYKPHLTDAQIAQAGSGAADAPLDVEAQTLFESRVIGDKVIQEVEHQASHTHNDHDHHHHDHSHDQDHNHDHEHSHDHDHDHDHDHSHEPGGYECASSSTPIIPTHDQDFRGFVGHLERKVKPWQDPSAAHMHTEGVELLPWYKLATVSDPHNVRNYMIGAWWLKSMKSDTQKEEALKFLDSGIDKNPDAYELYLMKGYITRETDYAAARQLFEKSADLALKRRPKTGPAENSNWDITDEEQMLAAMTMNTLLTRDLQTTASAIQVTQHYLQALPGEPSLNRLLKSLQSAEAE